MEISRAGCVLTAGPPFTREQELWPSQTPHTWGCRPPLPCVSSEGPRSFGTELYEGSFESAPQSLQDSSYFLEDPRWNPPPGMLWLWQLLSHTEEDRWFRPMLCISKGSLCMTSPQHPLGTHFVRSALVLGHLLRVLAALGGRELSYSHLAVTGTHGDGGVAAVGEELCLSGQKRGLSTRSLKETLLSTQITHRTQGPPPSPTSASTPKASFPTPVSMLAHSSGPKETEVMGRLSCHSGTSQVVVGRLKMRHEGQDKTHTATLPSLRTCF